MPAGIPEGQWILVGPSGRFLLPGWHLGAKLRGEGVTTQGELSPSGPRPLAASGRSAWDQNPVVCGVWPAGPRLARGSPTLGKMPIRDSPSSLHSLAKPAVLHAIQWDAPRTDGADMGRAMVARLGLGLLLLALLLPTQIYSNQTTAVTSSSNSTQNTSTTPSPPNATTKASGGALQSTASLFMISVSLLHLYC